MDISELKFAANIDGCKQARDYLTSIGEWSMKLERLDGYSIVFRANELYYKKKKDDTKLN